MSQPLQTSQTALRLHEAAEDLGVDLGTLLGWVAYITGGDKPAPVVLSFTRWCRVCGSPVPAGEFHDHLLEQWMAEP